MHIDNRFLFNLMRGSNFRRGKFCNPIGFWRNALDAAWPIALLHAFKS